MLINGKSGCGKTHYLLKYLETKCKKMHRPRRFPPIRGGRVNPKENSYYSPYRQDLERFKVYLNSREYFNVEFLQLVRCRWRDSEACDETNNDGIVDDKSFENTLMFKTMAAVWVATWECGVSQNDMKKPGIIGAIYRFHVYFTVRRILRSQGRLAFYILDNSGSVRESVWKYLPTMYELYDYKKSRVCKLVEITDKDFLYMVAPTTRGLTRTVNSINTGTITPGTNPYVWVKPR